MSAPNLKNLAFFLDGLRYSLLIGDVAAKRLPCILERLTEIWKNGGHDESAIASALRRRLGDHRHGSSPSGARAANSNTPKEHTRGAGLHQENQRCRVASESRPTLPQRYRQDPQSYGATLGYTELDSRLRT